jgi:hypothetical protein
MRPPPSTRAAKRKPERDDTLLVVCGKRVRRNQGYGSMRGSLRIHLLPWSADLLSSPPQNLIRIKDCVAPCRHEGPVWQPIASAPFDQDLELAVIDQEGPHALVFPCRRILHGWVNAQTHQQITVWPSHWRPWRDGPDHA